MSATTVWRLGDIAQRFGLELRGDADLPICGIATLSAAGPNQLSFLSNPQYRNQLQTTRAAAVILREDDAALREGAALVARDPYVTYAKVAALFESLPAALPGVHPTAVVDASARVHPDASVGPQCVVEAGSVVEAGAILGPGCIVGPDCHVGAQCRLTARVTLVTRVRLGRRVLIHPGAVIGSDGFGIAFDRDHWVKVPQLGGVTIGDDCEIGANCTIDRGALEDTLLEDDVRLDNQIQIAHNVVIGAHTAMAGCSAVAGSARIGRYCLIGGGAGILGHLSIADRVTVTAMSLVTHSIHAAGEYSSGTPIQENRQWRRNAARFRQLDELARRVKAIEKDAKQ
ncbi:UDP-3-O-(3-hydroxymyristoyl)glucosamine N-acyltransferase [Tahibacter amnicola]|uniref:UDP-3-O-acylglucosamine N-acyltransferase n=1 Tax=Tahibacter amnicola TaxID=2976241 RepID=A0ABY6B9Q9_9GAMM|nr:UDP-3-O-(3-hydroxymyristoyl)glucosamine N-acyltransferase [Tahibacter amnicola]UXI66803.1 UDP-3-O-(3-hydroxymyristoyl)glucosamine N-acyltransferase [Tahibacter amnicola]